MVVGMARRPGIGALHAVNEKEYCLACKLCCGNIYMSLQKLNHNTCRIFVISVCYNAVMICLSNECGVILICSCGY